MEDKVYKIFEELNIGYEKVEHPALFTCEDNDKYGVVINGLQCKNLFVRNQKKSNYYLVALPSEKRADLKQLQEKLQDTKLSFGNEDTLYEKLGIRSGAVSILNIIEVEKTDVTVVIDKSLLEADKVAFHPNINTATLLFSPNEIERIMNRYNIKYKFIEI